LIGRRTVAKPAPLSGAALPDIELFGPRRLAITGHINNEGKISLYAFYIWLTTAKAVFLGPARTRRGQINEDQPIGSDSTI